MRWTILSSLYRRCKPVLGGFGTTPRHISSRYTCAFLAAYEGQLNLAACWIQAVRIVSHSPGVFLFERSSRTRALHAGTSPTGQYIAAPAPTSRITGRSLATTGVPQAIASTIGNPN